jgi:hypothetical protein
MAPSMLDRLTRSLATYKRGPAWSFFFLRLLRVPSKAPVLVWRELRDCLCRNGVLHLGDKVVYSILPLGGMDAHFVSRLLDASPNHSLSLQSERASLYFNLCRGGVYSFTRRDWSPRVGMLVCCYALRSSILEIHLLGEVPGGVSSWCGGVMSTFQY